MDKKTVVAGIGELLWDVLPSGRRCGGAPANVVYHLNKLGTPALLASSVGRDSDGDELLDFLRSQGVNTAGVTRNDLPTGTVTVQLTNGIPQYEIHQPAAWDAIVPAAALRQVIPDLKAAVYGSLAQRDPRSASVIRGMLAALPEDCLAIFDINLRQNFYTRETLEISLNYANVLKLNEEELAVLAEIFALPGNAETQLTALASRFQLRQIICTLGAAGSMLWNNGRSTRYPVKPCIVADTVGCGDAFLAAWCHVRLQGGTPEAAMEAGTELSARVASCHGAMC